MDWFKYIITPILIFSGGYLYLRLAGKKAVIQMNSFDLLVVLVLGTVLAQPLSSKQTFETLYFGLAFVVLYVLFSFLTLNNKLRWLLVATSTVLIRDGDIDEKGLRKVRMTVAELMSELRIKGFANSKDIEIAVMESAGQISVIPKATTRPVQSRDLQLNPSPTFIPIPLIMDGQVIDHNLKFLQKDQNWLRNELARYSLDSGDYSSVTLATYNQEGTVDVDTNNPNDRLQTPQNYKPGNSN
ncbi:DUF421 domain-containing protein [Alkalihalobacillus sp. AL-G]|uniref:DUF421 domain-containing protein n=1 Tax=Alkalihalobacillus sp. AL-G TaxID=2926399 RepID=UPI00272C054B|nr:DUF421 domain-containing protein [Alkalihalobacillus sp. AL-G]WLD92786.1 DUF421 domain-containing protein [Alkalihalobacillus sp. AL-G]